MKIHRDSDIKTSLFCLESYTSEEKSRMAYQSEPTETEASGIGLPLILS